MKKKIFILVNISLTFLLPSLVFPQIAPDLGKAADFVLFTASGTITNITPTSNFIGNIGSNNDPNAGSPAAGFGNVNGQIHNVDAESQQCATDLASANNNLLLQAPTQPDPSTAGVLGNGIILKKGVYSMSTITSLSGNLTLDAEGNANAVFIFKVAANFNSAAGAKILLTNAALACNIFWQINGNITLSSITSFKGNIIANGAISFSTMDTLEGRALSIGGAITTSGTVAEIPIGCGSSSLTGPMRPNLSSLIGYELFTSSGQVANGGLISRTSEPGKSYIVGNVGTNFGIIAGFEPPTEVIGTININNAETAQASSDLNTAYTDVNSLPYYTELLSPLTLGNDLVLTPHTYFLNGETLLTGNLIFDAQGNSNAIFVIQVNADFSSMEASQVVLKDSAKSCNIYWKIEGTVSLASNSIFKGTIISNAAIDLQSNIVLDGRVLTRSGNITINADTARIPSDCSNRPLPLTVVDFNAYKMNEMDVLITWNTQNQNIANHFNVEVAYDNDQITGMKFHPLAEVVAKRNSVIDSYSVLDNEFYKNGMRYYRLKIIDNDGSFSYSNVKALKFDKKFFSLLNIYPNPIQGNNIIKLSFYSGSSGDAILSISTAEGKKMLSKVLRLNKGANGFIEEVGKLSKGMYLVMVNNLRSGNILKGSFQKL